LTANDRHWACGGKLWCPAAVNSVLRSGLCSLLLHQKVAELQVRDELSPERRRHGAEQPHAPNHGPTVLNSITGPEARSLLHLLLCWLCLLEIIISIGGTRRLARTDLHVCADRSMSAHTVRGRKQFAMLLHDVRGPLSGSGDSPWRRGTTALSHVTTAWWYGE